MKESVEYFMNEALKEAQIAFQHDEVPVGAIIVKDGEIIARSYNTREKTQISTHHAEIIAIEQACKYLNTWRLEECTMYVTLEPCAMCAGALILSRIKKVYFGAYDTKSGSVVSISNMLDNDQYNHMVSYEGGILESDCSHILKDFFRKIRNTKNN